MGGKVRGCSMIMRAKEGVGSFHTYFGGSSSPLCAGCYTLPSYGTTVPDLQGAMTGLASLVAVGVEAEEMTTPHLHTTIIHLLRIRRHLHPEARQLERLPRKHKAAGDQAFGPERSGVQQRATWLGIEVKISGQGLKSQPLIMEAMAREARDGVAEGALGLAADLALAQVLAQVDMKVLGLEVRAGDSFTMSFYPQTLSRFLVYHRNKRCCGCPRVYINISLHPMAICFC